MASQGFNYATSARGGRSNSHRYAVRRAAFVPKQLETVQCRMEHVSVYPRPAATDVVAEKSHAYHITKSALDCSTAKFKLRFHFMAEGFGATSEAIVFLHKMMDE